LGPMVENDPRLHQVLHADPNDQIDYSVFQWDQMVAEIGIGFPTSEHPYYVITNMSVKPTLKWQWIGAQVIKQSMKLHKLKVGQTRRAYVGNKNIKAKQFFEHNDRVCLSNPPANDDMFLLEFRWAK
jgi:hypothetical protein